MNMRGLISPVQQDFIWLAEYANGEKLTEFNLETRQENSFYDINKSELIRFGLVGHGMNFYYEVFGGVFKLAGQMIEVVYKVGDKEYYLTGHHQMYNDIISYKDADTYINLVTGGDGFTEISQYNFGYKKEVIFDDVTFNFKPICKIPHQNPIIITFHLSANKNLDGVIQIKKNGRVTTELVAPLRSNMAGELNWRIDA